jgi:hypothetical protein
MDIVYNMAGGRVPRVSKTVHQKEFGNDIIAFVAYVKKVRYSHQIQTHFVFGYCFLPPSE